MSLLRHVNFTKGWPSPTIREAVLPAASGVTVEMGLIGTRNLAASEGWVLGISDILDLPYVFRNGSGENDAAPAADIVGTIYATVPFGGIHGISFDNPIEFETTRWSDDNGDDDIPARGDLLFADTDGYLKVARLAAGTNRGTDRVMIARCLKAPYRVGDHNYILVEPISGARSINVAS